MDVGVWLRELGLEHYAETFRSNEVDWDLIPELSEADLEKLGLPLGARKRILKAIVDLNLTAVAPEPAWNEAATAPTPDKAGERRQISVLFCDLVGSTALSARLDPEDFQTLIAAYHRAASQVIERFEGTVAQFLGDGVLAYFGYSQAREYDAECAVRAALALVETIGRLDMSEALHCRVGIATGLVVTGEIGTGAAQLRGALGETPNLAARLQGFAAADTVIIDAATQRILANLFEYRNFGTIEVKGFAAPVQVYEVLRPSAVESRFEAMRGKMLTPLVGRDDEIDRLLAGWRHARTGRGQVVVLSGDAGIGKSRLAAVVQERIADEPHLRLRYFCSPHFQAAPLYPFIGQLNRAAGLAREDNAETKLAKLEATLALGQTTAEDVVLIADLLSLTIESRFSKLQLTPERRRERTMAALLRQLPALSNQSPVLMMFEDAQWIDPTSRELLDRIVRALVDLPVLLLITVRGDFAAPWTAMPHVARVALRPFGPRESARLVEAVAGGALSKDTIVEIVNRTDGVPLFLEELTKAILESGVSSDPLRSVVARLVPGSPAVPPALYASLMARLDRLGAAKEVAQIGAAIAREFPYDLLHAVAGRGDGDLKAALDRLIGSGLVSARGTPPRSTYLFKHALVQDAAYGAMLRQTRRELHRRIANALESSFPEIVGSQPHVVAHHYNEAGSNEKAMAFWLKAGQQALERSALMEATTHLQRGLTLIPTLPEAIRRDQSELELQLALGKALIATKGYTVPETIACFGRARQLCTALGDPPQLVPVLHGQWTQALMRNELASAQRRAAEILHVGETRNDAFWRWMGYRFSGVTCFPRGDFLGARAFLEQGLARYPEALQAMPGDDESRVVMRLTLLEGHVVIMTYLSWVLLYLGYFDEGRRLRETALGQARETSQAYPLAHAVNGLVFTELLLNAPASALHHIDELAALTGQHRISYYGAMQDIFRGWCLAQLGEARAGISILGKGLSLYRESGTLIYVPTFLRLLAEAHGLAGEPKPGLARIDEALQMIEDADARVDEAETHRVRGRLLLALGERDNAEESYRLALAVSDRQSAQLLKLRAAMDLARLWLEDGKLREARRLLEPIHSWFSEGFDVADLKEASALLATLM
jgi:class 3 adenylate cyclase/predicted ATPase